MNRVNDIIVSIHCCGCGVVAKQLVFHKVDVSHNYPPFSVSRIANGVRPECHMPVFENFWGVSKHLAEGLAVKVVKTTRSGNLRYEMGYLGLK